MEINFPKIEKKILKYWKKNNIFQKSIEKRRRSPNFVFYEGPPYANALPGIHHLLARAFKDIICRYKTMCGFKVLRKAGWDTHGLPTEMEVEKKLSIKAKKEIEKLGIEKFIKECKKNVFTYKKNWEKFTERIGYWLDLKNPYITCANDYIETLWWILKEIWQKGLLYQDFKVVPYCPRCGTSLSSHEVAQGYQKIKEPAIYVKFEILNPKFETKGKIYFLVWTTTPWTLPGNVAIAVNPQFTYVEVKVNNEYLILAKERLSVLTGNYEVVREFKGKDLVSLRYEALYPKEEALKIAYQVLPADFVFLEEGTGFVHIAPAFGEEDMELIKIQNSKFKIQNLPELPILLTVDEEGKFKFDVKKLAGLFVKDADPLIVEDLKERNLLFKEELYEHDYPFCWRCDTPLLYYAKKSWFIRTTKIKEDLIKNNKKINWIPAHLKEGRFGEWLREIKDWAISRERYWGTPLPVWQCKNCQNLELIGGKKDILKQDFTSNTYFILRHGETVYQTELKKIAYPKPEVPLVGLTERGKEEIKVLIPKLKKLKIDLILSSDFFRTKETAEILAKELNLKIKFDKRLRDVNLGIYHGRPKEELYRAFANIEERFSKKPKKGESWSDCKKRIVNFLKDIDKKYKNKKILIVGHGDPLWLLEGAMKGLSNKELITQRFKKKIIKTGELRKLDFKILPYNEKMELDFHRPYLDEVKFYCPQCGDLMERVPEVIDCWFDSGSMPFAQYHYPFENKKLVDKNFQFPADFISEGIDQTRGWFYTLLAVSTLLDFRPPYKNVISLGIVLDEKGEKMSKSKGNVVDPWLILEKYGADSTRWYFYTINQPGDSKLFSEKDVDQTLKKFNLILWNSYLFWETYSQKSKIKIQNSKLKLKNQNLLDRWIFSKLNGLIQEVTNYLDKYNVTGAARLIEEFVIDDLSLWYIRRSRKRFQRPENEKDLKEASQILGFVILTLCKLTAPFIPFLSEEIYQKIQNPKGARQGGRVAGGLESKIQNSVHLEDWPKVDKSLIDKNLENQMKKVREIVSLALAERAKIKIKVRQPLSKLKIKNLKLKIDKELLDLIKEEVNVKEVVFNQKIKKEVELDTKITPELKKEGIVREVIRQIQEMRKELGLKPRHKILIQYSSSLSLNKILIENKNTIIKETKAKDFLPVFQPEGKFDRKKEVKVDGEKLYLAIKKV